MKPERFTYPFCYTPHPDIVAAADRLIHKIDGDDSLHALFAEGKMLGVMMVEDKDGGIGYLYGFSGVAGGKSLIEGFVPPILDLTEPGGYFKTKEAEISEISHMIARMRSCGAPEVETAALKAHRRELSIALQEWIFDHYMVSNALGETLSIAEVFAMQGIVPPGGTGDCAAPKMLQHAYRCGVKPLAMGEFWYGASPVREIRRQGCFYPSCTGKCGPLLGFMMQGLDVEPNPLSAEVGSEIRIIYQDNAVIVADKPSGMIAVPGKNGQRSLQELLEEHLGRKVYACHRLDMDTSGLMVFALCAECQSAIQKQFSARTVRKRYKALLMPGESVLKCGDKGRIELPIAADWYDRPRQMVGAEGKASVTEYEILDVLPDGKVWVSFTPLTGRTHQLRVHAAHPMGLGRPIVGDRLYGGRETSGPLKLCAYKLEFDHPGTGERMIFDLSAYKEII